jgi:hypothetical protein
MLGCEPTDRRWSANGGIEHFLQEVDMTKGKTRWMSWTFGLALAAGLIAYPFATKTAMAEDHDYNPRIHHALEALRDARHELKDAPHDFHGHKQEAIDAIDHAIEQLDRIKDWH